MTLSPRDQIFEYLDGPKVEDRYHRTVLDGMPLGKATTDQIQHYLANRRVLEDHLDEETVFDELCRLNRQADEETTDAFARTSQSIDKRRAQQLAAEAPDNGIAERSIVQIAYGMLRDGWAENQVRYALTTLAEAG